jgi:hypothetical protein
MHTRKCEVATPSATQEWQGTCVFLWEKGDNSLGREERLVGTRVVDFFRGGEVKGGTHKPGLVKQGWADGGVVNDQKTGLAPTMGPTCGPRHRYPGSNWAA